MKTLIPRKEKKKDGDIQKYIIQNKIGREGKKKKRRRYTKVYQLKKENKTAGKSSSIRKL